MPTGLEAAEQTARQLVRYRRDFRAFAQEQLKLFGNPLQFWPCQFPLIESIERQFEQKGYARCVYLKARQVGASTLAQAFVAWRTMLWPHINAIVIADQAERAKSLFDICRSFYEQLDESIKPMGRYATKSQLVLANPSQVGRGSDPGLQSRILVDSAHKKSVAIGASWTIAHLSEAARYPDPEYVLDGIIPAVHLVPGTMIIIESSAEKAGTWYRDFFEDAQKGRNAFEATFVPWYLQPEYFICPVCGLNVCADKDHMKKSMKILDLTGDERHIMAEHALYPGHINWMRLKLAEFMGDWDLFRQSFPLTPEDAWVTPGIQTFPEKYLKEQKENIRPPKRICEVYPGPRILDAPQGRLYIWKEPEPGKAYDVGVDIALGVGKDEGDVSEDELKHRDASVACIVERGSCEQVAQWYSKALDPFELANMLYWLGMYYNQAQIAVETNAIGSGTNSQLAKMSYPNQYIWRFRDEITPRYSKKTGWETNRKSKAWLVGFAVHELVNSRVIIRSELLLREMQNFVRKDVDEWGAVAGMHDDTCFVPWTCVVTERGTERIEGVKVGDRVLGHDGEFHDVLAVGRREISEEIVDLFPHGLSPIKCTIEHPFYARIRVRSNPVKWRSETWVRADQLRKGDFVWVPCAPKTASCLSDDIMYLFGWYLADGSLSSEGQLRISCALDEQKSAKRLKSILKSLIKDHPTEWYAGRGRKAKRIKHSKVSILRTKNTLNVECTNKWLAQFITGWVGKSCRKFVHPAFIHSENNLNYVVGFLEGDGGQKNKRGAISAAQVGLEVVDAIVGMLRNSGVWATRNSQLPRQDIYNISIGAPWVNLLLSLVKSEKFKKVKRKQSHPFVRGSVGGFWVPVAAASRSQYSGAVHNMSVSNSNSYTANGVAVHNCMAWMIAVLISDDESFEKYYGLQRKVRSETISDSKPKPEPWEADLTFNKPKSSRRVEPWD